MRPDELEGGSDYAQSVYELNFDFTLHAITGRGKDGGDDGDDDDVGIYFPVMMTMIDCGNAHLLLVCKSNRHAPLCCWYTVGREL